ncbi:MAG: 50S ribosomal protein L3 [Myxococcales bacterium]|nr:50S ribosomal protein L3 [Myxococcales bacterium]
MALIGKKLGVTQIFKNGARIPVTVVELGPNTIIQKKTREGKDGYDAIQLGFDEKPHKKVGKAMKGHFQRADVKPVRFIREVRCTAEKVTEFEVGQQVSCDLFQVGELVDVTGTSKGKGFQGVMRRHNMKGAKQKTHGTHEQFRHVGSIGCRTTPGEVDKGKRLPGQMGNTTSTTQNVQIVGVDTENNRVLIRGSVPGARNGYVIVKQSMKKLGRIKTIGIEGASS